MSGTAAILGDDRSQNDTYTQVRGHGHSMTLDDLQAAMARSGTFRSLLLRFTQAFLTQTAQTALANGRAKLDERLSRWILMAHDRLDGDDLPLTHEFLALMLGVRRPGATTALHELEGQGLIRSLRGNVIVIDREGLEEAANGSNGFAEAELRRLIGNGRKVFRE